MIETLSQLESQAKERFCRFPVVITGDKKAAISKVEAFLSGHDKNEISWISEQTPASFKNITHLKANNIIGHEYQHIVYDIDSHFDPNLFAALTGTLKGGGLFIILCQNINETLSKQKNINLFFWRFIRIISQDTRCITINTTQKGNIDCRHENLGALPKHRCSTPSLEHLTEQQNKAIDGIIHVTKGHRNRPYVLLADRGRGKSAALGIAASKLLRSGLKKILLTAPSLEACNIIFKHLSLNLPAATVNKGYIKFNNGELIFIPPDELIRSRPKTDLLIIDEAAGITAPTLDTLLQHYSRIVFASTLHGYEGSGQYFSVHFFKQLSTVTPGWKKSILTTPIRWSENDPLEKLVNTLFLLKPLANSIEIKTERSYADISIKKITPKELINNEQRLSQLYELLSTAHYKTQPSDLQNIINEPNIHIFISIANDQIIAAAFVIEEGKIEPELENEILLGNRRVKGQIIPQTLSLHLGLENIAQYHYLRIMRIAVLPLHQSKGCGSSLINHITRFAEKNRFDFMGCSFASTCELIHFWGKLHFNVIRLGSHRKANARGFSALMLKALNSTSSAVHEEALQHFHENFPHQLKETHRQLDHKLVIAIFKNIATTDIPTAEKPSTKDIKHLVTFAQNNRQLEDNLSAINKLILYAFSQQITHENLSSHQLALLTMKVLQQHNWQDTTKALNLPGKKAGNIKLKNTTLTLLQTLDLIT